jgi:small-conductance mechanosensitive channel
MEWNQMNLRQLVTEVRFFRQHLNWNILGFNTGPWLTFLFVTLVCFVAGLAIRSILKRYLGRFARLTSSRFDDMVVALIARTKTLVLLVLALYAGSFALNLSRGWAEIVEITAFVALLVQVGLWGNLVIVYLIEGALTRHPQQDEGLATAMGALNFLSRVMLWSLITLFLLGSLHVNITALVTGLGVGGVAVALALQNILGDLFASLSILIDRPFALGHFIVIDDLAGTVEHVGVKSTRVRSLSGEEIVLSNGDLLKSRIHNYKRLYERRILFSFGVTYSTDAAKLAAIPLMVRKIIEGIAKTRFDRAHFKEFGDSSLNFEVVYFVLDPDYNLYMDIQQKINLGMVQRFAQENIEFAFPTRTLHVVGQEASASDEARARHVETATNSQ